MRNTTLLLMATLVLGSCKNDKKTETNSPEPEQMAMTEEDSQEKPDFDIMPIEHATAVFNIDTTVFYIDPVGGAEAFKDQSKSNVVLITDIHGDHLNAETLKAVITPETKIVAPQAVADQLDKGMKQQMTILGNGETTEIYGISITGVPMYNLREEAKEFHTKGRGNGYVLEKDGLRVYFSGDTEDIPEMRDLKSIDYAFVCMNLPYTMTVESAADGVLAFAPKKVYPYHYRGQDGLSDVDKFKKLVEEGNPEIGVVQLDWYPNAEK
ncbi:MBL fold metallo-hydrolase [Flavimarina sp. Hel_I_48]|uniref:MBL fold metallo-hydrolase n=1 Tax=Flavimarina sp. Hel_I_48 TaxID=1392488 RepID=UPI0004DF6EF4|nr:MBL fold metallo-hydrolase [Flavimarina sp. Hel_I_48]